MTKIKTNPLPVLAATDCPACGADDSLVAFRNEARPLASGGVVTSVTGLSGHACEVCGDFFLDDASAAKFAKAGDALVVEARQQAGARLRKQRQGLNLTQAEAAELTGGGHNAFSRYESGQAQPVAAVHNLFTLLDHKPELLAVLRMKDGSRVEVMAKSKGAKVRAQAKTQKGKTLTRSPATGAFVTKKTQAAPAPARARRTAR